MHVEGVARGKQEIGLDPSCTEILGRLDDAWSGSGHHIVPVVAWLSRRPAFRPNPAEVDEVLVDSCRRTEAELHALGGMDVMVAGQPA